MAPTIYFPSINAQATIDADLKKGGTALVCGAWQEEDALGGSAYIGRIEYIRFTTIKPKKWDRLMVEEIDYLKHIRDNEFCYEFYE